jgi:hypothetical protein
LIQKLVRDSGFVPATSAKEDRRQSNNSSKIMQVKIILFGCKSPVEELFALSLIDHLDYQ